MNKTQKFLLFVLTPIILINIIVFGIYFKSNDNKTDKNISATALNDSVINNVLPIPTKKEKEKNKDIAEVYKAKILEEKSKPDNNNKNVDLNDLFGEKTPQQVNANSDDDFSPNLRGTTHKEENNKKKISQKGKKHTGSSGSGYREKNYSSSSSGKRNTGNNNNSGFDIPGLQDKDKQEEEQKTAEKSTTVRTRTGFTSVSKTGSGNSLNGTINAVVQNQKREVKSGSTVKIRIKMPLTVNGITIPANTILSGIAKLSNERVKITISKILYAGKIYSCNFSVYDIDGIEGIYIPGGLNQEIAKDQANQEVSRTTVNVPLVGSVSTNLGRKKIQDPSVTIPNGYKILLK